MKWEARKRRSGDYQGCSSKPGNCESGPLRAREPDPSSLALGGTLEEIPVGRSASQPPGSIPGGCEPSSYRPFWAPFICRAQRRHRACGEGMWG